MSEERLAVLRMLQEGKVSAEEALRLLDTLQETSAAAKGRPAPLAPSQAPGTGGPKMLRVRVFEEGKQVVNVNVPLQVARVAMRLVPKQYLEKGDLDLDDVLAAIQEGAQGKIVEVRDPDDDSGVEVYIE